MVSNVLACAAILRRHVRRLKSAGMLGLLGAVGLVPLALYMPRTDLWRYGLLSLVCLYAGRKIVEILNARSTLRQLSMEEQFLRYGSSGPHVQKCVRNEDHMWTRSRIVAGLKSIADNRLPTHLMADEKREHIIRRYRHAFRPMRPRLTIVDGGLIAVFISGLVAAPTIAIDLGTLMFLAGFLALAVCAAVEISRWFVNRQLVETLMRWFALLSEWTVRDCLEPLHVRSDAYSHRLLYFTQPWFADGTESDDGSGEDVYVVSGDGGVLPTMLDDHAGRH